MDHLKQLETLVSVAAKGSLTAAAQHEGVAPAVIGRRIDALEERLGEDQVVAHHGSMSRELRLRAEARLKTGEVRCAVATRGRANSAIRNRLRTAERMVKATRSQRYIGPVQYPHGNRHRTAG